MTDTRDYKCVNCGEPAAALYKSYGPTVLKLTKCGNCKGTVDKYVEYDPVIVMIDLVLMCKEAQRHVLYNTPFKSYWKLLIILMMVETYGVWRGDSLFNMAVNSMCRVRTTNTINFTHLNIPGDMLDWGLGGGAGGACGDWSRDQREPEPDLFIWEKDFYVKFSAVFAGVVAFILTVKLCMKLLRPQNNVSGSRLVAAFSLSHASSLSALVALVWGAAAAAGTRAAHLALVAAYTAAARASLFSVLYDCPLPLTLLTLMVGNVVKYATSFHVTPFLRSLLT